MPADVLARHQCMIYDGPASWSLPALVASTCRNLDAGLRCMYINSPAMVAGLRSRLYATGTDVHHEVARGALVLSADDDHLVDGRFVSDRLIDTLKAAVDRALADGYAGLFVTGDMTWEFGPEKDFAKLLDYEWRLEQLFLEQPALSGICQYHRDLLPPEAIREALVSHERLFINDTLTRLNPHFLQARSLTQRKAAAGPELDDSLAALLAARA